MNSLDRFQEKAISTDPVYRLESALLKLPQPNIITSHSFRPGFYERKITIPPFTVLTGAIHKTSYYVRVEQGSIAVNTDNGIFVLTAPFSFDAPAGVKRVGFTFDSVVWVDVYENPDDCEDIAILEDRIYDHEGVGLGENRVLKQDRADYLVFLSQIGLSESQVWAVANNESDQIPMPDGFDVAVQDSAIHGKGLFALRGFLPGELIAPGRLAGKRTPAGRYINHSIRSNAETFKDENGDLSAVATRHIFPGEEILIDYRNSMRINFGITLEGER